MWPDPFWLFFTLEAYHCASHASVLFGVRLLPRKDLVKVRPYFLLDAACAAGAYWLHQAPYFFPILILQQWQHIFYFSTWDASAAAKRVISWSSLDWDRGRWNQVDLVLGTAFDLGVHVANTYLLALHLSPSAQLLGLLVVAAAYHGVLNSPNHSWGSRYTRLPDWVARRVAPLTSDQRQEVPWMEQLAGTPAS